MTSTYLRYITASAVLVSAVVHFELWWRQGYQDIDVIGPLFLLNAIGGLAIAVTLVVWRHWLPALGAVGFGVATLGGFILSTTVGLFDVHETWSGGPQIVAAISEAVAILGGLGVLGAMRQRSTSGYARSAERG